MAFAPYIELALLKIFVKENYKMYNQNNRTAGTIGEEVAVQYLIKNNYRILERNFRYKRFGEIDIISRENDYVCFVEVKSRSSISFGYPREAVNFKKQENIKKLAQIYIGKHGLYNENIRFDVVEVYIDKKGNETDIKDVVIIKNAF
jgi:putative endonuclease